MVLNPLVGLVIEGWAEFDRVLDGLDAGDATSQVDGGSSFAWTASLLHTFARSAGGYVGFTLARYAICLAVMLPATFCAGITLPLIIRILLGEGVGERAVGAIYGWNTLGSIVGVAAASLVCLASGPPSMTFQ